MLIIPIGLSLQIGCDLSIKKQMFKSKLVVEPFMGEVTYTIKTVCGSDVKPSELERITHKLESLGARIVAQDNKLVFAYTGDHSQFLTDLGELPEGMRLGAKGLAEYAREKGILSTVSAGLSNEGANSTMSETDRFYKNEVL